ncbi:MAG: hypothetical protein MK226_04350 [Saprospiraceae bacterium]|nr:hypothetical protein [Saprospiraceae bacterium]
MRKVSLAILFLFVFHHFILAQEAVTSFKYDIGLTVFPGNWGGDGALDMELIYKQKLEVGKIRIKIGADNRALVYPNWRRIADIKSSISDSTNLFVLSVFDQQTNYSLSLGYEREWFRYGRYSLIGAIDFFGRIRNANINAREQIERVETREVLEVLDETSWNTRYSDLGIVLAIGFNIQITDRINARVNFGANGNLLYQEVPYWGLDKEEKVLDEVITTGDLLILQDLAVTYSF